MTKKAQDPLVLEVGQEIEIPGNPAFDDGKPIRLKRVMLADMTPAPYNPRVISPEAMAALMASLSRFGLADIPCWNERTGLVVGGHQRLKLLSDVGVQDTIVVVKDLSEVEERALNVTLNNPTIAGEFTEDVVGMLEDLMAQDASVNLEGLGFEDLSRAMLDKIQSATRSIVGSHDPTGDYASGVSKTHSGMIEIGIPAELMSDESFKASLTAFLEPHGLTFRIRLVASTYTTQKRVEP